MTNNPKPTTIVIFGASGDLAKRMLIPGLFSLHCKKRLPEICNIVGFAATDWDETVFRRTMAEAINEHAQHQYSHEEWESFEARMHYQAGNFKFLDDFLRLDKNLKLVEGVPSHRLYYLAAPPQFFTDIVKNLGESGMVKEAEEENSGAVWRRAVVEKPFGQDYSSARKLNEDLHQSLSEEQIFRIDHYLAKETVQNILFFRFGNAMFEPIWNRNYIDHVQITVSEDVDVDQRGSYYDRVGVMRDMFQNHLMQLLALVSMEPPAEFNADSIRNEKVKIFSSVSPIDIDYVNKNTIRGQYNGYHDVMGVKEKSSTPTFAAIKLYIDNWRWKGVPFYLRSGKALEKKSTEIIIQFKEPPHSLFPMSSDQDLRSNYLSLCLQPHEGIHQRFEVKVPDTDAEMKSVYMAFHYDEAFGEDSIPSAYERLLLDAIGGDATLFTRSDGIEQAWKTIDSILSVWESSDLPPLTKYERGTWGPEEAEALLAREGRHWRHSCTEHD